MQEKSAAIYPSNPLTNWLDTVFIPICRNQIEYGELLILSMSQALFLAERWRI